MAITVGASPDQYAPVYNPVGFTVSSNNYAQSNFEFVADIYINSAATMTRRLKFPAYPGQNYGFVDIGGVLKDYLTSNVYFQSDQSDFYLNDTSILRYDVQWGESYGPSSGVTVYNNLTSSNGYSFNGSLDHVNAGITNTISHWVTWSSSNYTAASQIKFLTISPRTLDIESDEGYGLYFLNSVAGEAYDCSVQFYNSSDVLLSSASFVNNTSGVTTYDTRYQRVLVGPNNLTVLGSGPPANTSYYNIFLRDASGNTSSETFRFNIVDKCSNAVTNYRFVFKNRYGAFDTKTFYGQYERTSETDKKYFQTIPGVWSGGIFYQTITERSEKQYSTITRENFKCWSDWISQGESDWLEDLFSSPEVHVINKTASTSTYIPVTIVGNQYTYKTVGKDQLFNLEINFRPTVNKVRQQF